MIDRATEEQMIIKISHKNQRPFWRGLKRDVPEEYGHLVREAVMLRLMQCKDPYASRSYNAHGGLVIHVQQQQRSEEYGVK